MGITRSSPCPKARPACLLSCSLCPPAARWGEGAPCLQTEIGKACAIPIPASQWALCCPDTLGSSGSQCTELRHGAPAASTLRHSRGASWGPAMRGLLTCTAVVEPQALLSKSHGLRCKGAVCERPRQYVGDSSFLFIPASQPGCLQVSWDQAAGSPILRLHRWRAARPWLHIQAMCLRSVTHSLPQLAQGTSTGRSVGSGRLQSHICLRRERGCTAGKGQIGPETCETARRGEGRDQGSQGASYLQWSLSSMGTLRWFSSTSAIPFHKPARHLNLLPCVANVIVQLLIPGWLVCLFVCLGLGE